MDAIFSWIGAHPWWFFSGCVMLGLLSSWGRRIQRRQDIEAGVAAALRKDRSATETTGAFLDADTSDVGATPSSPQALSDLADDLFLAYPGRKIEAVKRYRHATGTGLRQAKDAIDLASRRAKQGRP